MNNILYQFLGKLVAEEIFTELENINNKLEVIMATQSEEAATLIAVKTQLDKAATEISGKIDALTAAVAAAGVTSPEVDAATADLKAAAQKLDDIVPD